MQVNFSGVFPAITTPFKSDGSVDYDFLQKHVRWLIEEGNHGIVPLGSLGEGATLTHQEKRDILKACVEALPDSPIVPGIAGLSTAEACSLIEDAAKIGCKGAMVLPPYAYSTDWREMRTHVEIVMRATDLPCILYNNPVAYKTDFVPEQVAELAAANPNMKAVKESSTDVRRVTAIKALIGDKITLMVGVDDVIVEGIRAGATGWVAGLVSAFPKESVALWRWTLDGKDKETDELYKWFLPLLRLDTVPKFVQLIKLVQEMVGWGSVTVRPPRLELTGAELAEARAVINEALKTRPMV
ncbi:MAG: dihydrodipicolinate synthase family protein [Fimbriimonadaceae bacterium]|nr:dihydrodipicolinate synthase family protein [Fimbriimonadaceae bacterium]